jgi:hypothetical protein
MGYMTEISFEIGLTGARGAYTNRKKEGQCQVPTKKSKICRRGIWKGQAKGIFETFYAGE